MQRRDNGFDKDVFRHGFTSLEVVPLETAVLHTSASSCQKERVSLLSRTMIFLCEPLRKCTETGFEAKLEGKVWSCFLRVSLHCCSDPYEKDMSPAQNGAGIFHS